MTRTRWLVAWSAAVLACGGADGPSAPPAAGSVRITTTALPALALTEGHYEAWAIDATGGVRSLGKVVSLADVTFPAAGEVRAIEVTWERASDADPLPSVHRVLRGTFRGGVAELSVVGAVTLDGIEVHRAPGQFTMFSPSDNAERGYPSFEESGVWLFNMAPRQLPQNDMWVRLAQLRAGWVYEGWMVRDIGQPAAIWLSYGKFTPDATGAVNSRDDSGWGPFSGVLDYRSAGEEEFPGDDWISNPLKLPIPGGLSLPLNLRERDAQGRGRWTHVITIEPASDRGEAITTERPFVVRPYRDAFGDGGPGIARAITYRSEGVPAGEALLK